MAITKINTPELFDLGTTNSSLRLPSGDTASRPSNPNRGEWRYNTDDNYVEYWDGNAWFQIDYETVAPTCTTNTINYPTAITAYYKMEDATDQTGNYNGTATNVNFNVAGKFGNAGEFNGSSSFVALPFFNFVSGSSANFTASLWFNVTDMSGGNNLIQLSGSSATNSSFNVQLLPNGTLRIDSYGAAYAFSGLPTVSTNNWYNLVLVNAGGTCTPYLNGSAGNVLTHNISFSGSYSNLGARYVLGSLYTPDITTGKIDQVRIFPSALTSDQVTQLYNEVQCAPTIVPADNFNTVLYTGNNSNSQTVTGMGFAPDLVWNKQRNGAASHRLVDSVRGSGNYLYSNLTAANDGYNADYIRLASDGILLPGADSNFGTTNNWVVWGWKAGGAAVPNTDGDNNSAMVSANPDAGFSIITYTGDNANNSSVGHGLNKVPEMHIIKRTSSPSDWFIVHKDVNNYQAYLNFNTGTFTSNTSMNAPTDSVIRFMTTSPTFNGSSQDWLIYAFHSVDGMSKVGSYQGTGQPNNYVFTGFRPRWVMIKNTAGEGWNIVDSVRNPSNPANLNIQANDDAAESSTGNPAVQVDFYATGFSLVAPAGTPGEGQVNSNGSTYIFLAIAEEVFVPDNFFNDDSTAATYKLDGDAGDDSGNGYNGVATNVTYAAGKFDEAAVFNGSTSHINIDATSTTPIDFSSENFTISMWLNPSSLSSLNTILGKYSSSSDSPTTKRSIIIRHTSSGQIQVTENNGSAIFVQLSTGTISANTWSFVSYVREAGSSHIYINNNSAETQSRTNTIKDGSTQPITIGGVRPGNSEFNGKIDQVRIFNRALTSGEVEQLYNE